METEVIRANIQVHSRMAGTYETLEPHFRPENRHKVKKVLENLAKRFGANRLLDLGCGTGFILGLAKEIFHHLDGVDVTQAMMDRIDLTSGNIRLHRSPAENLPFADETFDLVSAYSFIHHVEDYSKVLAEAFRVLKKGGGFYIDLEPNRGFWELMTALSITDRSQHSPLLTKAIRSVVNTDEQVEIDFGIPKATFQKAEYGKSIEGGMDPANLENTARKLGFSEVEITYEWFLGQGDVLHGKSSRDADSVDWYLRQIAPLSNSWFKYLKAVLVK